MPLREGIRAEEGSEFTLPYDPFTHKAEQAEPLRMNSKAFLWPVTFLHGVKSFSRSYRHRKGGSITGAPDYYGF